MVLNHFRSQPVQTGNQNIDLTVKKKKIKTQTFKSKKKKQKVFMVASHGFYKHEGKGNERYRKDWNKKEEAKGKSSVLLVA